VIDETNRMNEITDWTLAYVLAMLDGGTATQSNDLPTIAVSGSKQE
jgi:hypothetical protein